MEILDIVDAYGNPTGETVERTIAHEQGIRHRTAHVWIARKKHGCIQLLLQKRSEEKDSYPGCYDISSAGHIPAGMDFETSALRELKEELGYTASKEDLIYCGQRVFELQEKFHDKEFHDCQVSRIYMLWLDREPEFFTLQKEEVSEVRWFDFEDCMKKIKQEKIPQCIIDEELDILKKAIKGIEQIEIRPAADADLEWVTRIEAEAFPEAEAAPRSSFEWRLSVLKKSFLVAEFTDASGKKHMVGMINARPTCSERIEDELFVNGGSLDGNIQAVMGLAVRPVYQHQQIGSKLMNAFIDQMHKIGYDVIILTCKKEKISFYEKFGYENIGISQSVHGGAVWYDMILR